MMHFGLYFGLFTSEYIWDDICDAVRILEHTKLDILMLERFNFNYRVYNLNIIFSSSDTAF